MIYLLAALIGAANVGAGFFIGYKAGKKKAYDEMLQDIYP